MHCYEWKAKTEKGANSISPVLLKIWAQFINKLCSLVSPNTSVLFHPQLNKNESISQFTNWQRKGFEKFKDWIVYNQVKSQDEMQECIKNTELALFEYFQI